MVSERGVNRRRYYGSAYTSRVENAVLHAESQGRKSKEVDPRIKLLATVIEDPLQLQIMVLRFGSSSRTRTTEEIAQITGVPESEVNAGIEKAFATIREAAKPGNGL